MSIRRKIQRLINPFKQAWSHDRITALSGEVQALRGEVNALRDKLAELATREEVDLFKSSLEVPFELMDAFQQWKACHPIPEDPLVSVCVATYNRARLLTERCIPSILGQTYSNLELIVVGDACSDDTERLLVGMRDPRLKFVNLPERGHYPADPMRRWMVAGTIPGNHAMAMACGDYVTHLSDDDEYLPERLEKLVAFARAEPCDLIWHPFWWEVIAGQWLLRECQDFAWTQVTSGSVFYRAWLTKIPYDIRAHRLMEPGDWNRFRRLKYLGALCRRYPEPLLRHYLEHNRQPDEA